MKTVGVSLSLSLRWFVTSRDGEGEDKWLQTDQSEKIRNHVRLFPFLPRTLDTKISTRRLTFNVHCAFACPGLAIVSGFSLDRVVPRLILH